MLFHMLILALTLCISTPYMYVYLGHTVNKCTPPPPTPPPPTTTTTTTTQGLSRYLETGCPNRGFIEFCVSKVWYKIHNTNKIDPIPLQILLF